MSISQVSPGMSLGAVKVHPVSASKAEPGSILTANVPKSFCGWTVYSLRGLGFGRDFRMAWIHLSASRQKAPKEQCSFRLRRLLVATGPSPSLERWGLGPLFRASRQLCRASEPAFGGVWLPVEPVSNGEIIFRKVREAGSEVSPSGSVST